jgi:hypothetical protein
MQLVIDRMIDRYARIRIRIIDDSRVGVRLRISYTRVRFELDLVRFGYRREDTIVSAWLKGIFNPSTALAPTISANISLQLNCRIQISTDALVYIYWPINELCDFFGAVRILSQLRALGTASCRL